MAVPIKQVAKVASYVIKQKITGNKKYPLVLMLEPLFQCNLKCLGCGKINYPQEVLSKRMTKEEAWAAAKECKAPVISIAGGEPLLHEEMPEMVEGFVERKKFVYLCTNAQILKRKIDLYKPTDYFSFSVHLDGNKQNHDLNVAKEGAFDTTIEAIKLALDKGFRLTTNTTIFNNSSAKQVREFFDYITELGVEGMMLSPGFAYEEAQGQDMFLERKNVSKLFDEILSKPNPKWVFNHSPSFLAFLRGKKGYNYDCTPWGNVTYNIFGWQKPCYLINEGYCKTYQELLESVDWSKYGVKSGNPACANCMLHSGYEPTAVSDTFGSIGGLIRATKAFSGMKK